MSEPKTGTEPANGTVVGFGDPIGAAYVRLDEYAVEAGYEPEERWYPLDDHDSEPLRWSAVLNDQFNTTPYRLVREELS